MAKQNSDLHYKTRQEIIAQIMQNDLYGRKIYLLGSAEFGPTNEPILVKSSLKLKNIFGNRGTLINAWHEIKYTNKNAEVYLVKTTGEHSHAYLNVNIPEGDIVTDGFIIAASESNEIFDDTQIIIDIDKIVINHPKELKMKQLIYKYDDYPTISKLVNAINNDKKIKRSYIQAYFDVDPWIPTKTAFCSCNPSFIYLYGGKCGLDYTKDMLYNYLNKTYDILEGNEIDIIIPVDAFMDDIYPDDSEEQEYQYGRKFYHDYKDYLHEDTDGVQLSFMNQLINFCIIQLNFGMVTTGILGFNPLYQYSSDYLYESDNLGEMYKACFDYNMAHCENPFYSFLVSVVAGDVKYNHGVIIDNGYLAYAALCANTIYTTGTSNIPISNNISLYHEFSEEVLQDLAQNGIVTYRHSPLYDMPVIYDGITACSTENFKLYCNVRMIQMCIAYVNQLFQYYIGKDMHKLIKEKIFEIDLSNILGSLKSKNIITSYSFKLEPIYRKNKIKVYLTLQTNYMVKSVKLCSIADLSYTNQKEVQYE